MINATHFPAVRQAWNAATEDQQISSRELQAVRNQIQLVAPGLSENEIRAQLAQLLSETQNDLNPEQAQALLESVFQGETLTLQTAAASHEIDPQAVSFFEDPADAGDVAAGRVVDLEMGNASLTDANGVRTPGNGDISGTVDSLRLTVEGGVADFEQMLGATRAQLQDAVFEALSESLLSYRYDEQELQQAAAQIASHLRVESRSENGQQVYEFNLDPAFRDNLPGWMGGMISAAERVGLADLSNPMATLSSQNGQLTVDANNAMLSGALQSPEEAAPDFGPAPVSPMPADAAPASESAVREILGRIDRPGNDPRRQTQLISGDRDQRQLLNLYNQGALESLPPELRERAVFWASETAALDAERLLSNWSGRNPGENAALQQLLASPAFQALPVERRAALVRNSPAEALAQSLVSNGQLSEDQRGALASLAPYLNLTQETGRTQAEGMLQQGLEALRQQGIDVSARLESTPGPDGGQRYQLTPESLTLEGEALQRLMASHPELAQLGDLSNGRLTLSPEHFSLRFGTDGVQVELRNLSISGSTDVNAPGAEGNATEQGTTLTLDGTEGRAILDDNTHALTDLRLDELSGRLSGDITLDQEVVAAIEARVQNVLGELDGYLSQYGLGREQVQQLLAQLPGNALQQLGSSASQSQINQLAQQFGLGNEQIAGLMNLLQEQPVRQLLGELGGLTQRLGENSRLSGEAGFSLQNLNLSAGDSGWLASLGQLSLTLNATAEAPDGQQTALEGRLDAEDMHIDTASGAGGTGTVAGSLSAETVSSEPAAAAPSPAEQIDAFMQILASGGGDYREPASGANGRTEGHLRDEHRDAGGLRRGTGLRVETAHAELAKAPTSRWADMLQASEAEREAFFANNDPPIDRVAGNYLLQYLGQRVINQIPPVPDNQRVEVSGVLAEAEFDPNGLRFGDITGNATLDAESAGTETDVQVSGQIAGGSISADESGLGPVTVAGSGRFEDAAGRVTDITGEVQIEEVSMRPESAGPTPAEDITAFAELLASGGGDFREPASGANGRTEGHLRDEHRDAGGLRRGTGVRVETAQAQLAKAPASRWADMLNASQAEREAFFAEHGIQHGQYLLDYLNRHVVGQSGPEGGLTFSGVHAEGQATATEGGRSATLSGEASIAEARFGQNGATAEDLHAEAALDAGDTRMTLEVEADRATSDTDGLTMEAEASWSFEVDGNRAQTEARGSTTVSIVDSQIAGTHTEARDLSGHVEIDRGLFLDLLDDQNSRMADFFREHGILGQSRLQIDVTNTGDIRTGANGEVEEYQIRATTSGVNTPYGRAAASLYADDDGSITGNIEITPNNRLAQEMRTQMQAALRRAAADLMENSSIFNNNRANAEHLLRAADSLQVTLNNGRFEVSLQGRQYVNFNLDLSVVPNGRTIDVHIDQTELQNRFLNGLTQALGVDLNRRATEAIHAGLAEAGLRPRQQGDYTLSIQTEDLMRQILGPDASTARISPRFTENGNLDIQYWIN